MPFYQRGDVRIRYEEIGSGFPLLVTPGGGLNSRVSNWQTAVFNAMEEFKHDFRCITMDQRNANGGESTGPVPVENAWDALADDHLGLMDRLGIRDQRVQGRQVLFGEGLEPHRVDATPAARPARAACPRCSPARRACRPSRAR